MKSQEESVHGSGDQPYIREKIVKPKKSRWRYVSYMFACIFGGILFGGIACGTFVWLYPKLASYTQPPIESTEAPTITLPTHTQPEEIPSSSDSTYEESSAPDGETGETPESTERTEIPGETLSGAQKDWINNMIDQALRNDEVGLTDITAYARKLNQLYTEIEKSLVTIVPASETENVFGQMAIASTGIILSTMDATREALILTPIDTLNMGEALCVRFSGDTAYYAAELRGQDSILGLAVLSVAFVPAEQEMYGRLQAIQLGNTYLIRTFTSVLAVGAPYGKIGTVAYGSVVSVERELMTYDTVYRMFYTNIPTPTGGSGFLINLEGELVGIITNQYKNDSMQEYIAAIGTEEINRFLTNMANDAPSSYFGIVGQTVTTALAEQTGMPQGVYVMEVQADSPAYQAGISNGDIIVGISKAEITKVSQLAEVCASKHLPGETVIVTVMRRGRTGYKEIEITVILGQRP